MRGEDVFQESLFTTVQLESFVPSDHPLPAIKALLDEAMKNLNWLFGSNLCRHWPRVYPAGTADQSAVAPVALQHSQRATID